MPEPVNVIRLDRRGEADDIAVSDVRMFRMERMDSGRWWIAVHRGDDTLMFWLNSSRRIAVSYEDGIGCDLEGAHDGPE